MPSRCLTSLRAVRLAALTVAFTACSNSVAPSAPTTLPDQPVRGVFTPTTAAAVDVALDDVVERVAAAFGDNPEAVAMRASLLALRMAPANERDGAIDRVRLALMRMPNDAATAPERDVLALTIDAVAK